MKSGTAVLCGLALLLGATSALAQTFGSQGDAAFSVDRLFGIHGTHVSEELDPPQNGQNQVEDDYIGLSFAWRGPYAPQYSPFDAPRLAFDYFVIDRLSVGGSLAYAAGNDDSSDFVQGNTPPLPGPSDTAAFLFAPRAGYALMFNDVVGLWPRGGITYHSFTVSDVLSESGLALSLEAMFVLVPTAHFAIVLGPTFDVDLLGSRDYDIGAGNEVDRSYRSLGLGVGMLGWL